MKTRRQLSILSLSYTIQRIKKVSSYSSGKVIPAGTSTNVVISTFIPSDKDVSFAKVLITDSNTGFVIAEALELTLNSVDLFGNDFTTAWTMGSKTSAAGTINTDSDTDVFEFTAKADGLHVFETYGERIHLRRCITKTILLSQ